MGASRRVKRTTVEKMRRMGNSTSVTRTTWSWNQPVRRLGRQRIQEPLASLAGAIEHDDGIVVRHVSRQSPVERSTVNAAEHGPPECC